MSHYEERLERDLHLIRERLRTLGASLEEALQRSVTSLMTLDRPLAYETILGDQRINREAKEIDRLSHAFVARHLPSAGHLRFVSSVLRINIALERIGDYAVTICREAARLTEPPSGIVARELALLSGVAQKSLHQSLQAFEKQDPGLARTARQLSSGLGRTYDQIVYELATQVDQKRVTGLDSFALLLVLNRLSRVCDQAKNICEETLFVCTGQEKKPKSFKILFVDRGMSGWAHLAEALGKRDFSSRARYSCASLETPAELSLALASFMTGEGLPVLGYRPVTAGLDFETLNDFDIVISLEAGLTESLGSLPYHTVFLEWPLDGVVPEGEFTEETLRSVFLRLHEELSRLDSLISGNLSRIESAEASR